MKKSGLLILLEQVRVQAEAKEFPDVIRLEIIDLLLSYINDPHITEATEKIPC